MKSLHESMSKSGAFANRTIIETSGDLTGKFRAKFGQIGQHCQLSHPEESKLIIGVPSAAVRTRLNFMKPDIMAWARDYDGHISVINIVVTPELAYSESRHH